MEARTLNQTATVEANAVSGDEILLFTIENSHGAKLVVSNYGAAVISLLVRDRKGALVDVVLGYADTADYLTDEFYLGTVVGRYANRIAGNTVMIEGEPYKISTKAGGYHQHGGVTGFNKKYFKASLFEQERSRGVVFTYTSPHLEEGFPGEVMLEVIYTLDEDNQWTVAYHATSSKTTLINLTQHSYFNLSGDLSQPVDQQQLKIISKYYLPVNQLQVPTGEVAAVANTPFDFTDFKQIGQDINDDHQQLVLSGGYDHSFVLEREHTPFLKHAAVVQDISSGIKMDVYTTEPSVHFYSGNFLAHLNGKKGIAYDKRSGFCLETQHFPDAPNQPQFPSTILKAGEEFCSQTIFKFSVEV